MEPATEVDIWNNYLFYGRADRKKAIYKISGVHLANNNGAMEKNVAYQICTRRLHYRQVKESFSHPDDIVGLVRYWKVYWNTPEGKGTERVFIENYQKYLSSNPIP